MFARPTLLFRIVCFCFVSCISLLIASPAVVFAAKASDPISVISQTDTVSFPRYIDFSLTATDTLSSITKASITIEFNSEGFSSPHTITINAPAKRETLHWREDTSGNNFHIPGSRLRYQWQLQDSAGHSDLTQMQDTTTIDSRFPWHHLAQGELTVNWYDRSQDFGQVLLNDASGDLNNISQKLGGGPNSPLNLWIYTDNRDFQGSLTPGSYEWVGGVAYPLLNEALLSVTSANDDTLRRDLPHEMTHLVFHQLISSGIIAPTWFDEGLAVYNQQYHEPDMQFRFQEALNTHSLLRLDGISMSFPANANEAYLAYAQSWNLVQYIYSTFGQPKMTQFIRLMNNSNQSFSGDMVSALGVDIPHLENSWRLSLHQPGILPPVQLSPTLPSKPQGVPIPNQSTTADPTTLLLLGLGLLLVFVPAIILLLVIATMRRRKQQTAWAISGAQQVVSNTAEQEPPGRWQASPLLSHAPSEGSPGFLRSGDSDYTNPGVYRAPTSIPANFTQAGQTNYPFYNGNLGNPTQAFGGPSPQTPYPTYPTYPTYPPYDQYHQPLAPPNGQPLRPAGEFSAPSENMGYGNQEYLPQPPNKQAPQE